jgi:hypothetical protein
MSCTSREKREEEEEEKKKCIEFGRSEMDSRSAGRSLGLFIGRGRGGRRRRRRMRMRMSMSGNLVCVRDKEEDF